MSDRTSDMSFFLDRIPNRGILKSEHDKHVEQTGRSYTDPFVRAHSDTRGASADLPEATPMTRNRQRNYDKNIPVVLTASTKK